MRKTKQAGEVELPSSHFKPAPDQLDALLEDMSPSDRELIVEENRQVVAYRAQGGIGDLGFGRHLEVIQKKLEPQGKWHAYIKTLPNLTRPTAYRKIWGWQNTVATLPGATLQVAVAEGYGKLISQRKGEGYAKAYKAAVQKVTKELGPAPFENVKAAREWLRAVVKTKRELSKRETKPRKNEPVAALRKRLEFRCLNTFKASFERLPSDEVRKEFATRLAGTILAMAEVPKSHVEIMPIPREVGHPAAVVAAVAA